MDDLVYVFPREERPIDRWMISSLNMNEYVSKHITIDEIHHDNLCLYFLLPYHQVELQSKVQD